MLRGVRSLDEFRGVGYKPRVARVCVGMHPVPLLEGSPQARVGVDAVIDEVQGLQGVELEAVVREELVTGVAPAPLDGLPPSPERIPRRKRLQG